jgi:hypothetical protein
MQMPLFEIFKKLEEKGYIKPSPPPTKRPICLSIVDFEVYWEHYPNKVGKSKTKQMWNSQIKTERDGYLAFYALLKYLHYVQKTREDGFVNLRLKNGDTFFKSRKDWEYNEGTNDFSNWDYARGFNSLSRQIMYVTDLLSKPVDKKTIDLAQYYL